MGFGKDDQYLYHLLIVYMKIDSIIKNFINCLVAKHPTRYFSLIRNQYSFVFEYLKRRYKKLEGRPVSEYCYWILNNINDFPICQKIDKNGNKCNNRCKFLSIHRGYRRYCSRLCMQQSIFTEQSRVSTNIRKTGYSHSLNDPAIRKKIQQTVEVKKKNDKFYYQKIRQKCKDTIDRHVKDNPNYWIDARNKAKATNILNGKDPNWNNREKFKQTLSNFSFDRKQEIKIKKLNTFERHKAEDKDFIKRRTLKTRATKKERYGSETWQNIELRRQLKLQRYNDPGYHNIKKAEQTCIEKYGVRSYFQTFEFAKRRAKKYFSEKYCMSFDSRWEFLLYDFCIQHQINVIYHPEISFEYFFNKKKYVFQPDFKINDSLFEVKGDHFFKDKDPSKEMICPYKKKDWSDQRYQLECQKYEAKHRCMIENNVKILTSKDFDNLNRIFELQ